MTVLITLKSKVVEVHTLGTCTNAEATTAVGYA